MFELFAKSKRKPFVVSKEFVKEDLDNRKRKEPQEVREMAETFEENNLGKPKIKRKLVLIMINTFFVK